jgi:MinD-like ATPase involved in chromosome partitioning or flagellar assembly
LARELETDLLGQVPLDERLRECGDSGAPLVVESPDTPAAVAIREIADTLSTRLAPKVPAATRIKRPLSVL